MKLLVVVVWRIFRFRLLFRYSFLFPLSLLEKVQDLKENAKYVPQEMKHPSISMLLVYPDNHRLWRSLFFRCIWPTLKFPKTPTTWSFPKNPSSTYGWSQQTRGSRPTVRFIFSLFLIFDIARYVWKGHYKVTAGSYTKARLMEFYQTADAKLLLIL